MKTIIVVAVVIAYLLIAVGIGIFLKYLGSFYPTPLEKSTTIFDRWDWSPKTVSITPPQGVVE